MDERDICDDFSVLHELAERVARILRARSPRNNPYSQLTPELEQAVSELEKFLTETE